MESFPPCHRTSGTARRAVRRRRPWTALLLVLTALVPALAGAAPAVCAAPRPAITARPVLIPAPGGALLKGTVAEPGGRGPHPLVVMPRWAAMPELAMTRAQLTVAHRGYTAVVYSTRGLGGPAGVADMAGPRDVADVSHVIDWALRHTTGDPRHIGMVGASYGATLGMLAAAADPRVDAVAALSGWVDMMDVLEDHGTPTLMALAVTLYGSTVHGGGRRGALLRDFLRQDRERLAAWARPRSPITHLDTYNARGTAFFLAHTWGESVTPFGRMGEFFDRLRTPKRLEMRPGDHAGPEFATAALLSSELIDSVLRWMDHGLKGTGNGVDREAPVQIRPVNSGPMFGARYGFEGHAGWEAMTGSRHRLFPGAGRSLSDAPAGPPWRTTLITGLGTVADNGPVFIPRSVVKLVGAHVPRPLSLVLPGTGSVWATRPLPAPRYVRGTPQVRVTVTPSAGKGTIVFYLYDVDALGNGSLMTWGPWSFSGRAPGRPFTVETGLHPTAYDLPAGHRLAMVAGTTDSQMIGRNRLGARISLSSEPGSPSWLDVPLR
ncbi:CocE/NonD family hydrolase [Streptomyces sp. NPDC053048]|uniref:CocE/NonD family hydrolase n=1 Tax=Streptomyces sp. NPDC053048 TaxID=3365694 RepID=UPI0037D3E30B